MWGHNNACVHEVGLNFFFFFFFFFWRYNPLWVLAFSVTLFHSSLSLHNFLNPLIPIICISSSISSIHLFSGLIDQSSVSFFKRQTQVCTRQNTGSFLGLRLNSTYELEITRWQVFFQHYFLRWSFALLPYGLSVYKLQRLRRRTYRGSCIHWRLYTREW
jgi:hypothetical protein